jgi:hypothetical protein
MYCSAFPLLQSAVCNGGLFFKEVRRYSSSFTWSFNYSSSFHGLQSAVNKRWPYFQRVPPAIVHILTPVQLCSHCLAEAGPTCPGS